MNKNTTPTQKNIIILSRVKNITLICLTIVTVLMTSVLLSGCAGQQTTTLQGIVQETNTERKQLIIAARDGNVITIILDAITKIQLKQQSLDPSSLEPGLAVQIQREGQTARLIEINPAQIYGTIMITDYNQLTFQPSGSTQNMTVYAKPYTIILSKDNPVSLNQLKMGGIVEVYYNPVSRTAYRINEMPESFTIGPRSEGVLSN